MSEPEVFSGMTYHVVSCEIIHNFECRRQFDEDKLARIATLIEDADRLFLRYCVLGLVARDMKRFMRLESFVKLLLIKMVSFDKPVFRQTSCHRDSPLSGQTQSIIDI